MVQSKEEKRRAKKEAKKRYWKKLYDNAEVIECGCGCEKKIKSVDKYGRKKSFISGHNGRKYKNPTQYKREWNHRNRKSRYEYKREYTRKRKIFCINELGGKCVECGIKYDGRNACIFDCHHVDPSKKKYNLGTSRLTNISMNRVKVELKKCVLMCSNCHRLHHFEGF